MMPESLVSQAILCLDSDGLLVYTKHGILDILDKRTLPQCLRVCLLSKNCPERIILGT
jgi:hypothetical protein